MLGLPDVGGLSIAFNGVLQNTVGGDDVTVRHGDAEGVVGFVAGVIVDGIPALRARWLARYEDAIPVVHPTVSVFRLPARRNARAGFTRVGHCDDVFFDILRTYYDRFKYSNASTADFIAVAEEVSGQDLGDFFDAWLFEDEMPELPT